MPNLEPVRAVPDPQLQGGADAAAKLNAALKEIGLQLPSVSGTFPFHGTAMVSLGNAPAGLVDRLADWITEHA